MSLTHDGHQVVEGEVVEPTPGTALAVRAPQHRLLVAFERSPQGSYARRQLGRALLRFLFLTLPSDIGKGLAAWHRVWWRWKTLATDTEICIRENKYSVGANHRQEYRSKRTVQSFILAILLAIASALFIWLAPSSWHWAAGLTLLVALWTSGHSWTRPADAPADTRPPGWDGTILSILRALRAAKVLTKDQHVWMVGEPEEVGVGVQVTLDLAAGVTWKSVLDKKIPVGSGLGVDSEFMEVRKGDHDGQAVLWFTTLDPFAGGPERWPLLDAERCNAWEAHPFGRTPSGQLVPIKLMYSNYLGGGLPGSGKSFTARVVSAPYLLDPAVRVFCANGKGDGAWEAVKDLCIEYIRGARADDCWAVAAMLDVVIEEMYARYDLTTEKGVSKIVEEHGYAPWLVVIDELQQYTTSAEPTTETVWGKKNAPLGLVIIYKLVELAKLARAAGIILVLLTQKPSDKSLPTELRDQVSTRFANRVGNIHTSTQILGKSSADGVDAAKLPTRYKGVGILVPDMEACPVPGYPVLRPYMIDDGDWELLGKRGRELRRQAGTLGFLRGSQACAYPVPELLQRIFDLLDGVADDVRVPSKDLREALAPDLTETAFGQQLRKWGCPAGRDGSGSNKGPSGRLVSDIRAAVQRIRSGGPVEVV